MPSLNKSRVALDPGRWKPIAPVQGTAQTIPAPVMPVNLRQNPRMLSSLPSIATNVSTGSITQFYGSRTVPRRQVVLSS